MRASTAPLRRVTVTETIPGSGDSMRVQSLSLATLPATASLGRSGSARAAMPFSSISLGANGSTLNARVVATPEADSTTRTVCRPGVRSWNVAEDPDTTRCSTPSSVTSASPIGSSRPAGKRSQWNVADRPRRTPTGPASSSGDVSGPVSAAATAGPATDPGLRADSFPLMSRTVTETNASASAGRPAMSMSVRNGAPTRATGTSSTTSSMASGAAYTRYSAKSGRNAGVHRTRSVPP